MTGITLPLISYGGSSVMCTIFMLAIVQGLYIVRKDESDQNDKQDGQGRNEIKKEKQVEQSGDNEIDDLERRIREATEESLNW